MAETLIISIRRLIKADISVVAKLNTQLYGQPKNVKAQDIRFFEQSCLGRKKVADVFVAVCNGKIVGFLHSFDWASFGALGKVRHIAHLIIIEKFRGMGIGTRLIDFAADDAVKNGCGRIDTQALVNERHANAFYKGYGFKVNPQKKNNYQKYI